MEMQRQMPRPIEISSNPDYSNNGPITKRAKLNSTKGGYKRKKFINIKGYGKRLLRFTKTGNKYVILNKKRKYLK